MFGVNPKIELEKTPIPLPSVVLLFAIVGLAVVLQQTPRAVIVDDPASVILPPADAVVVVILLAIVVVIVGAVPNVVNFKSEP